MLLPQKSSNILFVCYRNLKFYLSVVEEEFDMVVGEMAKYEGKAIVSTSVDPISWMSDEMTRKLDCKMVLKNQRKFPILF